MNHLVERNDLTSNNIRWCASKVKQIIWQSLLDYTRISWEKTLKDSKREAIYDVILELGLTLLGVGTTSSTGG